MQGHTSNNWQSWDLNSKQFDSRAYSLNHHLVRPHQSLLISEIPVDCDETGHRECYKMPYNSGHMQDGKHKKEEKEVQPYQFADKIKFSDSQENT